MCENGNVQSYSQINKKDLNESYTQTRPPEQRKNIKSSNPYYNSLCNRYQEEKSLSMSLIVGICTKNGIAMAGDKRSVMVKGQNISKNGGDLKKVFHSNNFILATWDSNEISINGTTCKIESVIRIILSDKDCLSETDFLEKFMNTISQDKWNNGNTYCFLTGSKNSNGYYMKEWSVTTSKINLIWCGTEGNLTKIVKSVSEYGEILEKNGLVDRFPVGDGVDCEVFV